MATEPAPIFNLSWKDIKKGLIVAAIGGAVAAILPAASAGTIFTLAVLQAAGNGAAVGVIAYLAKNFLTNSNDQFMTKEPK